MNNRMTTPEEKLREEERRERLELLRRYLDKRYKITIKGFSRLDRGVYKMDKADGRSWVVRVFPINRPLERVQGDATFCVIWEKMIFRLNDAPLQIRFLRLVEEAF
jgi:hypothetical protein